jgi:hypothetical protein
MAGLLVSKLERGGGNHIWKERIFMSISTQNINAVEL